MVDAFCAAVAANRLNVSEESLRMTDETREQRPIAPPDTKHPDDRARVPLEAALGIIPGVSSLLKLVGEFMPTQAQKSRSKWESAISARTNEHADRLDEQDQALNPTTTLTGPSVQLAVALARAPGDGMAGRGRMLADLCALLPDVERKAVEQAGFELKSHGLVTIDRAIGRDNWWLRLTQKFYEQLDHQVMGWGSSTAEDARVLAKLLLEDETREWTPTLHAASGWEPRRFNPAFSALLRLIPDERVSGEVQPDYPAQSLCLLPEDRAKLQKLIGCPRDTSTSGSAAPAER